MPTPARRQALLVRSPVAAVRAPRQSTTRGGPHRAGQSRMCEGVALGKDGQGVPNPNSRPSFKPPSFHLDRGLIDDRSFWSLFGWRTISLARQAQPGLDQIGCSS